MPSVAIAGEEKIVPPVEYGVTQWIVGFPNPKEVKIKVENRRTKDLRQAQKEKAENMVGIITVGLNNTHF